jgi:hypothetical protein
MSLRTTQSFYGNRRIIPAASTDKFYRSVNSELGRDGPTGADRGHGMEMASMLVMTEASAREAPDTAANARRADVRSSRNLDALSPRRLAFVRWALDNRHRR